LYFLTPNQFWCCYYKEQSKKSAIIIQIVLFPLAFCTNTLNHKIYPVLWCDLIGFGSSNFPNFSFPPKGFEKKVIIMEKKHSIPHLIFSLVCQKHQDPDLLKL